jgi:hypothetical protein
MARWLSGFRPGARSLVLLLLLMGLVATAIELMLLARLATQISGIMFAVSHEWAQSEAAQEMEINGREQEAALFSYLNTVDPAYQARLSDSQADFQVFLAQYRAGRPTIRGR